MPSMSSSSRDSIVVDSPEIFNGEDEALGIGRARPLIVIFFDDLVDVLGDADALDEPLEVIQSRLVGAAGRRKVSAPARESLADVVEDDDEEGEEEEDEEEGPSSMFVHQAVEPIHSSR